MICDQELPLRLATAQRLGITTAQILAPPETERTPRHIEELKSRFIQAGIQITVVFCGFPGESYADIPTVKTTVGLAPTKTRAERLTAAYKIADFARLVQVKAVGLHIGFIPEEQNDPDYRPLVEAVRSLCDHCAGHGQAVHLETGQETAHVLLRFLQDVDRQNLAVNFDPANMILYGAGEPIPALEMLAPYVRSVHLKDALWAAHPGQEWGVEVPLGSGDVNMEQFLQTLINNDYAAPLTIEREIVGEKQALDIEAGAALIRSLLNRLL